MENFDDEQWVSLYCSALVELDHARMTGRIDAARTELLVRLEVLPHMPGLHPEERQAIEDAFCGLRALCEEELRYNAEEKRRVLNVAAQKLRSVAPAILKKQDDDMSE